MQPTGSGSPWPMWPILSSHSLESWSESELTDPATPRITRELTNYPSLRRDWKCLSKIFDILRYLCILS